MSPTARTLAALRDDGWMAAVVEFWNPHTTTRHDLFGFADILAVRGPQTLAVQATSNPNQAARVTKLVALEAVQRCLEAGWSVEVWGWKKYAKPVNRRWWRPTITPIRM